MKTVFDFMPNILQEGLFKSANAVDIQSFKFFRVTGTGGT
jgi:hypothetical protein